ncbi:MAG: transposase [Actinobacteria bacterium]|nr:transposase [Actinomycetota bacterium]
MALLSELGDTRRFSSSKKAVRYAGLDITPSTVPTTSERQASSAGKVRRC